VTRFSAAASKRPAAYSVRTQRSNVVCTYNSARACVLCMSGNSYLYHHKYQGKTYGMEGHVMW